MRKTPLENITNYPKTPKLELILLQWVPDWNPKYGPKTKQKYPKLTKNEPQGPPTGGPNCFLSYFHSEGCQTVSCVVRSWSDNGKSYNSYWAKMQDPPVFRPCPGPKNRKFDKMRKTPLENITNYPKIPKLEHIPLKWLPDWNPKYGPKTPKID